jgi:hypothetical protein
VEIFRVGLCEVNGVVTVLASFLMPELIFPTSGTRKEKGWTVYRKQGTFHLPKSGVALHILFIFKIVMENQQCQEAIFCHPAQGY